jgi:hypothetical protein
MSRQIQFRLFLTILMTGIVLGLLYWQEQRYSVLNACHASGGAWDGGRNLCRPKPAIYLERGLKRS